MGDTKRTTNSKAKNSTNLPDTDKLSPEQQELLRDSVDQIRKETRILFKDFLTDHEIRLSHIEDKLGVSDASEGSSYPKAPDYCYT